MCGVSSRIFRALPFTDVLFVRCPSPGGKGGGAGVERGSSCARKPPDGSRSTGALQHRLRTVYRHVTSPSPQVRSGEPKTNFYFSRRPSLGQRRLEGRTPASPGEPQPSPRRRRPPGPRHRLRSSKCRILRIVTTDNNVVTYTSTHPRPITHRRPHGRLPSRQPRLPRPPPPSLHSLHSRRSLLHHVNLRKTPAGCPEVWAWLRLQLLRLKGNLKGDLKGAAFRAR